MKPPLQVLDKLGDEFARVAREDADGHAAKPRRRRRWVFLAVPIALTVGGGALAAGKLLKGEPLRNRAGTEFHPGVGLGVPNGVAGATLTSLRVADPAGGPPWGVRVLKTTRGYGCVQVGRVVDGQFGVLGRDGALGNDGLFHPWPSDVVRQQNCGLLDGAGRPFVAISQSGLPASGAPDACAPGPQLRGMRSVRRMVPGRKLPLPPECPPADLRNVRYGVLGPQGESVTYRGDDGRPHTAAAVGPDGAYLVVLRPTKAHPSRGQWVTGPTPMSGLISVQYRGGRVCRIPSPATRGGAKPCPLVGYVQPRTKRIVAADVVTGVRAVEDPALVRPTAGVPPGTVPPLQRRVMLSFTARVATDGRAGYSYELHVAKGVPHPGCDFFGLSGPASLRDVKAGEVIRTVVYLPPKCTTTLVGSVRHHAARPDDPAIGESRNPRKDAVVGSFRIRLRER